MPGAFYIITINYATILLRRAFARDYWPLSVLLLFTLVSTVGYTVFNLPPHGPVNLSKFADYPAVLNFYAISFSFFGQVHVWLTALALIYYLTRHLGLRWVKAFLVVYAVSLSSELIGTQYGLPFGPYRYTALLGDTWFGHVPYLIPLSWFTMAVPAFLLAQALYPARRWARVLFGAFVVLMWDFTLDPAMSFLTSYWIWDVPGTFYGMPYINWFGWYVTGAFLMGVLEWTGAASWLPKVTTRWMGAYYLTVLSMPVGMVLVNGMWEPLLLTALGLGLVYGLFRSKTGAGPLARPTEPGDALTEPEADLTLPPAEATRAYFADHSRTFSFASNWFAPEDRLVVQSVYTYCRYTDDLVDEHLDRSPDELRARLAAWLDLTRRAYAGEPVGIPWLETLMQRSASSAVPFSLMEDLVAGVESDIGTVRVQTLAEMDRYGYQVASVVGVWMCHLFGVKDWWLLDRAAALGRAMQLTNILRDVGEDLARDRIYLPAEVLRAFGVTETDLRQMAETGRPTHAYQILIEHLIVRADADYAKAWEGIVALPESFGNAIAVAANVYQGIHQRIIKNRYNNLTRRAYTSRFQKSLLALKGRYRLNQARKHDDPLVPQESAAPGQPLRTSST